ncbi:DUF84 family protein [Lentibacillus lipolyticus]|nr:DUF84 family protein [Lentibacillus lipolyticus]
MNIIVGSKNPAKIAAVESVFTQNHVLAAEAPSQVSAQPFSDAETRLGAINRATYCLQAASGDIGIGLEGGVMYVDDRLYLCNWGALVTMDNTIFTASGARILLPAEIDEELRKGKELGDVMDAYAKRQDVRKREGAIGIFTNEHISRKEMFIHVVKLLHGQWEFAN